MGSKKIRLLSIIFVSILVLLPSEIQPGELHFGIIKAIEKKLGELKEKEAPYSRLPDISKFLTEKSDRFVMNIDHITGGVPFKGERAKQPHAGAHVNLNNSSNIWPQGGTDPENYPPIYAAADGFIELVDYSFRYGEELDQYVIWLTFATDSSGEGYYLDYGIEPMIAEPWDGFYEPFILVKEGQEVKKGDVIAYFYVPEGGEYAHIHFHIKRLDKEDFMAPAIFTPAVVEQFHAKWGEEGYDNGTPMPPCMGYMLEAHENPFGTGAVDAL